MTECQMGAIFRTIVVGYLTGKMVRSPMGDSLGT